MTKELKIMLAVAGAVIVGGIMLAIFANPAPKEPGAPVDEQSLIRANSYVIGNRDAKVKVVEFGDFQCPACAAAHPAVKQILAGYEGNADVAFFYRHFPLTSIHPSANISAEAAEAAGAQGKFWEMHDLLFQRQNQWTSLPDPLDTFVGYASELGLNVDEFRSAVSQRRHSEVINTDLQDGQNVGVGATPTFFVNGVKISGASELKVKIDEALALPESGQQDQNSPSVNSEAPAEVPPATEETPTQAQ